MRLLAVGAGCRCEHWAYKQDSEERKIADGRIGGDTYWAGLLLHPIDRNIIGVCNYNSKRVGLDEDLVHHRP